MIPDFIRDAGTELPFILLLLALLGFRSRVTPRASLFIAAPPEKVFPLVDFTEGQNQRWQRTRVTSTLIEPETRTYRLSFMTPLARVLSSRRKRCSVSSGASRRIFSKSTAPGSTASRPTTSSSR